MKWKPFSYQEKLLRDESKRIVVCAGRQVGKSTTIAVKAIYFALTHPKTNTLIISATLRQSMLMFDKILDFIEGSPIRKSLTYRSRTRLRFSNGSWIIALPAGRYGSTLRGHTAHLIILDEAAFIYEEVISNAVLPQISTTDGSVWMLSTPWSKDHIFYRAFTSPEWSKYHLPSSINPLIKKEFLEEQRKLIGDRRYRLEYEAEFVEDENSFFPMGLIQSCLSDYEPRISERGENYLGFDFGGREDLNAIVSVERKDKLIVQYCKAWMQDDYTGATLQVYDHYKLYSHKIVCLEEIGAGIPIVEHLKELSVPTLSVKSYDIQEVMLNLRALMERKEVSISHNFTDLIASLNCIEFQRNRAGGYTFSHKYGAHDDLGRALALACWAAKQGKGKFLPIF
ncbi:MAG: phage terminase large subunit [Nitrososphaerales archaeon]